MLSSLSDAVNTTIIGQPGLADGSVTVDATVSKRGSAMQELVPEPGHESPVHQAATQRSGLDLTREFLHAERRRCRAKAMDRETTR
jgi:hypothetical protein